MEDYKKILINNCLTKSYKALEDAQFNYENNRFSVTLNRLYYAIFYSVMALAYKDDFITSKHKQLMGWFNKKYIHEDKVFESELSNIYQKAYKDRQESDYEITNLQEISTGEIKLAIDSSAHFIKEINKYLTVLMNKA